MSKILVGMSGGVDSAVAAYLLKKEGHEVVGLTLRTWESETGEDSRCCEIDDARRVAGKLGIPYHVQNCLSDFKRFVTEPFTEQYIHGFTPNPCVECNRYVKWDRMLFYADILKMDYVATGHYAHVIKLDNGRYTVKCATHAKKDQTYMLFRLTQEQLSRTLMPLGDYIKDEVRKIATDAGIPVADKPDSQEICFVTDGHYADFIKENAKEDVPGPGEFVDEEGNVLGTHKGIIHYTVGQRKGLNLALGYPAYIKSINADTNEIIIGQENSIYSREIICREVNYLSIQGLEPGDELRRRAKVRYHFPLKDAVITPVDKDSIRIIFDEPVKAAAPGQSAVFYDNDDCVIGGGMIYEVKG